MHAGLGNQFVPVNKNPAEAGLGDFSMGALSAEHVKVLHPELIPYVAAPIPLILIAIMTFVLITSSGTMALAVNYGYRKNKWVTFWLLLATAILGATFVGMQVFEWSKLIFEEGVRPWGNPMGAAQFGSVFFMVTGFHGFHVSIGVIFLFIFCYKVAAGHLDDQTPGWFTKRGGNYEEIEILGLYWHFVDLVWVFIFAFFYLW